LISFGKLLLLRLFPFPLLASDTNASSLYSGSDSAGPALGTAWGLSLHHELFLFVDKCGFTPLEALRSATSVTAKRFGFDDRGRIAKGLKADLVLIEGNPVEDIDATLNLRGVWRDGALAEFYEGSV
jgi:N-acyl-D-aspartate/D-glutamate deacylase